MHSTRSLTQWFEQLERFCAQAMSPESLLGPYDAARERKRIALAASFGLTGVQVALEHGGFGAPYSIKAKLAQRLAGVDFGVSMAVINSQNVADHVSRWLPSAVSKRWVPGLLSGDLIGCTALTEPGAGSDFSAITTLAVKTRDGWRLQGEKAWIINAKIADVFLVYAQTQPGAGAAGIAAFVVEAKRKGFERSGDAFTSVAAFSSTAGFRLQGYVARDDEVLHAPGLAFKRALESINGARVYVAAMCVGMLEESLRIAQAYGQRRQTFGQVLEQHQGWRWALAEAAVDLEAARALVQCAAQAIDEGGQSQDLAAKAKVFATRAAQRHLPALLHAMGAEGLRDSYPLMRHVAAAQVAPLVDGSTEMLLERISKNLKNTG
ncbi:MAG: acyl-CoA dehydrogenase family protein [Alcaligenaceae bacterium]